MDKPQVVNLTKKSLVKSITLLQPGDAGNVERTTLYKPKSRRVSKRWRKLDKMVRRLSTSQSAAANEYLQRHERSNQKKKNGWLKDIGKNVSKAQRKGIKKLKIRFI